jgi:Protein of unknown function (DUF4238)
LSQPKRHHVQPQRYLRGFSIPDRDGWIELLQLGAQPLGPQQVQNVALETHYNSVQRKDGTLDATLEGLLAELEDATYPAIQKLRDGQELEGEERGDRALFVNNMLNRSQAHRARIEQHAVEHTRWTYDLIMADDRWRDQCFEWLRVVKGTTEETFERDLKRLIAGVDTKERRNIGLVAHTNTTARAEFIGKMSWTYVYAPPGQHFLTSDNPITILAPGRGDWGASPVGLKHKGAVLTFPLTREVAFMADWSSEDLDYVVKAKPALVKQINERTVRGTRRFVYSPYAATSLKRLVASLAPDEGPGFEMATAPYGPGRISWIRTKIPRPNW